MLFEGVWVFGLIVSGPGLIFSVGLDDGGGHPVCVSTMARGVSGACGGGGLGVGLSFYGV